MDNKIATDVKELFNREHAVCFRNELINSNKEAVLITHKNCNDGFGCGAIYDYFMLQNRPDLHDNLQIIYIQYSDDFEKIILEADLSGKLVIIADFSFELGILNIIRDLADNVILIDHHESAKHLIDQIDCYIDMTKSGSGLLEQFLFPDVLTTPLTAYIQDRDIWTWKLPSSKEVNAYLSLYNKQAIFNNLYREARYSPDAFINTAINSGEAILEYQNNHINKVTNSNKIKMVNWGKYEVPFINTTTLVSEIGNELAKQYPFAIMYFITGTEIVFSFRSTGLDLTTLGVPRGHKLAAGRSIPLKDINLNYLFKTKHVGAYLTSVFHAYADMRDTVFHDVFGCDIIPFIIYQAHKKVFRNKPWAKDFIDVGHKVRTHLRDAVSAQVYFKRLYKDIDPNYDAKYRASILSLGSKIITYLNYLLYPWQPEQTDSGNNGKVSRSDIYLWKIKNISLSEDIAMLEKTIEEIIFKHQLTW